MLSSRIHSFSLNISNHRNNPQSTIRSFGETDSYLPTKQDFQRHERPTPGARAQMDSCKIALGIYQYTAIEDCSSYRVLRCYSRRTSGNSVDFIECVLEEMLFPMQCIQTNRGREFFADKVMIYGIKSLVPTSQVHLT